MEQTITPIGNSIQQIGSIIAAYVPNILGAIIILVLGIALAIALEKLIVRLFASDRVEGNLERAGVSSALRRVSPQLSVARIIAWIAKWFIILATIVVVSESLGLVQMTDFLNQVLLYIPRVIVAMAILLIGIMAAQFVERVLREALKTAQVKSNEMIATFAKWAITIFSGLVALTQLGIAPTLINTLIGGFVAMIAIAGGLAFGIGGQDAARDLLNRMRKDLTTQ